MYFIENSDIFIEDLVKVKIIKNQWNFKEYDKFYSTTFL
jgi:hypothetical protein